MIIRQLAAGLSQADGGPAYSVPRLSRQLREARQDVLLRTLEPMAGNALSAAAMAENPCLHPRAAGPLGRLLGQSPDLLAALRQDARQADIIHTHGLWLLPNIYPARALREQRRGQGAKARLVHSVRGMLGPQALQFSKWKKRAVWLAMQRQALARSHCLHATALSEHAEIRAAGLGNPVAVIPNGIDIPDLGAFPRGSAAAPRTVLSLGRLHRKKGLDRLIEAWASLGPARKGWRLRIVGPAEEGHDGELRRLAAQLQLDDVAIEGPVYGEEVLRAYRGSDLFVLPTSNENFAMTVAEALAAEVPVISTRGAPWSGLEENGCGWWVDATSAAIAGAMRQAMAMPRESLHRMGSRGRGWMERDFGWQSIARDMIAVYEWLALDGSPPACVKFD